MTGRDYGDYISDIVSSIEDVGNFIGGMEREDFLNDKKTINAVVRSIEIIGEAVKKIPEGIRKKYPSIPWKQIAGMRDKMIHEYHGVDETIVWVVASEELPSFRKTFEKMLNEL